MIDLGLELEKTVVIITGAGGQIGRVIVDAFLSAGCYVGAFDIDKFKFTTQHDRVLWVEVDTTDEQAMNAAWVKVGAHFQSLPTVCICAAALDLSFIKRHSSVISMPTEQFRRTFDVNVAGTFITAKLWLRHLRKGMEEQKINTSDNNTTYTDNKEQTPLARQPNKTKNISLIIIGSEAGVWGVPGNPDYAASKSAVQHGLMLSLAPDAAEIHPQARVNSVCPGTVDTARFQQECAEDPSGSMQWVEGEATVALKKPVQREDIARLCLFLASGRWSASITGQSWRVDGGKTGRLFWGKNGDATWT